MLLVEQSAVRQVADGGMDRRELDLGSGTDEREQNAEEG